ncbi:MAG TPA: DegT/DnrJ/EryC1/StrS family aminotransferase, partial [Longimicrobiales bacterium]|nr:DegT/DnrJ/EryC1/StrS family aminotransferase [Longimicrobiales bacterium]
MSVPLLDLQRQYKTIQKEIDAEVLRVVGNQRFILGPDVEKLEKDIGTYTGSPHPIACASGTDAILLALKALQLEPGDEVIAPSFTFFATAGAIWNAGLKPVFVDIDGATFNVTAQTIEAAITPRTKAIIVVHLYGQMARMPEIIALAAKHGIPVIEDAAQSLSARQRIDGKEVHSGTIGEIGTYSFFPSKNLGAFGDAGLIVTNDDKLAELMRKLRVHGGIQMYHHEMVGTNSRLDALQAAVLSAKLPHLNGWSEARRRNADYYNTAFAGLANVKTPVTLPENYHVFNQYTLRVERRDELKKHLDGKGIGNAIYYPLPLHLQECFASLGGKRGDLPVTELAALEAISIPVFPELR